MALMPSVSMATIVGGTHDFTYQFGGGRVGDTVNGVVLTQDTPSGITTFKWGGSTTTYINPCQVCHIPHKAPDAGTTKAPLWNHAKSQNSSYVTYDQGNSATFKLLGLTATLGSSVACLSCHDGSMAINQQYGTGKTPQINGATGTAVYNPSWSVETATTTAGDFDAIAFGAPGPYLGRADLTHMHPIGVSYTAAQAVDAGLQPITGILNQMLKGQNRTVECASCHDIHGVIGVSGTTSHSVIVDLNNAALCRTCHLQ